MSTLGSLVAAAVALAASLGWLGFPAQAAIAPTVSTHVHTYDTPHIGVAPLRVPTDWQAES